MATLWPPRHASLVGARHRARGTVCQDSSLSATGTLADGTPYSLLLVADGHGDPRHHRSDRGSRHACAVAHELVQQAAADADTDWRSWLPAVFADGLPQRWRQRCQADHAAEPNDAAFSTVPYGTTLGLALLTPQWWLCGGIGDWDLALIQSDGAALVSSEPPQPGGGEATYSLCMEAETAAAQIRQRGQWHALPLEPAPALALVLSSDGVRKSCLSERDHLVLCHYLAKECLPEQQRDESVDLLAALEQITSRGVGDDVSVACSALGGLTLEGELH